MQTNDIPDPLRPLMMHVNGCLNLRSSHRTDLAVYPTPPLNINEGNGRVVTETPSLKERDSMKLVHGPCNYMYLTFRSLVLNFMLGMNSDCLCSVPSQYHGLNDVEIDRLGDAVIKLYSSTLHTVSRLPVTRSTIL